MEGKIVDGAVLIAVGIEAAGKRRVLGCGNHWSVENQLHWRIDVLFHEDQARMRAEFSAQNHAVLRRLGIGLFSRDTTKGLSMRRKRVRTAWSMESIESLIFG